MYACHATAAMVIFQQQMQCYLMTANSKLLHSFSIPLHYTMKFFYLCLKEQMFSLRGRFKFLCMFNDGDYINFTCTIYSL
jgi:hypothetical protein